ncbi:hypothetical protein BBJ29_006849 [Phytophthora kernoviae]|uniref:E3 ubiquitin-protein ligase listerin n=1 Tax=Phytophthora kernoviae TaxID=325452 RepID=A0A3F2RUV9_9STRA|nr:hypothetical protein BBJ29_006849 [Phytophthora kernoviae]RLN64218.1 hypothetical protein BBP00_00003616 [Phytophthora kernoviae]
MAKKNKQREKQEQSRASSSARAHQTLLASTGSGTAPPAFIGFASFAQSAPDAIQATPKASSFYSKPVVQSIYDGSDHEIMLALKMLAKKGAVTKNKALNTFLQDVLPPRQPQELRPMLGHFTQLYTFEMRDQNDRKVRQLLNEVLAALADKMKPRAFVPHLQRLLPYWFLAMHDVHADVAALAKKAFEKLFTDKEMRKAVVEEHLESLMEEFRLFFTKTPDTFEGIPLQPDEKEERYERCISAAVLSIDAVVKLFAENEMTDKLNDEEAGCSVASVVTSDKFMRLTTASSKHPNFTRDIVRRAMYVVLVTLCTKAKAIVAAKEEAFGKVVLGILGDKSPANHEDMWNAVLLFLQAFPNVWHSSPSFPKFVVSAVYPRLFAQIRHGFYGSGRSSFPTLLPLLSMVPLSVAIDPIKGQSMLYTGVLEQCWKFIESKDARFSEPPAITAYFECLTGFFSIFLNTKENAVWLSEQAAEPFEANYVNQFKKVFVSSITTALSLHDFPDGQVELYADSLLKMDCNVQFGDMAEASDIIQHGLQFSITDDGNKLWLSCGSWQNHLKGRLDDLDANAFAILLGACLGGLSHFPVVSPDAVVILCHFVIQNGVGSRDAVVMQILTHLCELFYKLNGELPAELEAVEAGTVSFNTKKFAAYVKSYVQLAADQAVLSVSQLVEKLDAIHLRCDEDDSKSRQKVFYNRVLSGLGDEPILSRLEGTLAPGSTTVVEITEWIDVAEYVSALAVRAEGAASIFCGKWEKVARLVITHAIAGKTETAKVAALKVQKRSPVFTERGTIKGVEEQVVLAYSSELVVARLALMNLVSAMYTSNADNLQELATHYREALLATVLCAFAESAQLKANIVSTYVATASPVQCFNLTYLWFSVEKVLAMVLSALHSTLTSIHDVEDVRRLVLESFGGIETLASLFNGERFPLPPMVRVLLYILASYSGALRLLTYDASAIDVNGEDEAATEAALARVLIPKALRSALRAVFAVKKGDSGGTNIRMRSRKQKPQEREDVVGKLLLWDLFLQLFPTSGNGDENNEGPSSAMVASSLSSYVARYGMLSNFLDFSATLLSQDTQSAGKAPSSELHDSPLFEVTDLAKKEDNEVWSIEKTRVFQLGTRVFFRTVVRLPAMVRSWWNDDCSRAMRSWAAKYFEDHITPSVLAAELELIQKAGGSTSSAGDQWDEDEMTVKGSRVSREITTTYVKDECALEMVLRVPSSYPLRSVEVECTKRIGISEDRWRRWVLQIIRVTASSDGSLLDAVMLWKGNVDKEFEGVEPCPICYSILNPKNMGLPSLPCKTCSNKYHNSCLYKWFNQSGKNKCPICQQPFC